MTEEDVFVLLLVLGLVGFAYWYATRKPPTVAPTQVPCGVPVTFGGAIGTSIPCGVVKEVADQVVKTGTSIGSWAPNQLNKLVGGNTGGDPVNSSGHIDAQILISRAMCDFYNEGKVFGGNPLVVESATYGQLRGGGLVKAVMPGSLCVKGDCDCSPVVMPGDSTGEWGSVRYRHKDQTYTTSYDFRPLKISGLRNYTGGGTTINLGNIF